MPKMIGVDIRVVTRKDKSDLIFGSNSDGTFFVNCFDDALKKQLYAAAQSGYPLDLTVTSYKEPTAGSFIVSSVDA